jgi:hypothetical protein
MFPKTGLAPGHNSKTFIQEARFMLFELNPEKIEIGLHVKHGGGSFRVDHQLRRPKEADWINYDKGLSVAIEDAEEKGSVRYMDDSLHAACKFWDAIAIGISGYAETIPPNFKDLVPPEHKRAAILTLLLVGPSLESFGRSGLFLVSDEEIVRLRAERGEKYPDLVHHFKSPTTKQRIEFSRIQSDSYTIKGMKSGKDKVILPSRLAPIIRLYDDLILLAEGYSINGNPVEDRDDVIRFMDAQHKRMAIQLLFAVDEVDIEEPEQSEVAANV